MRIPPPPREEYELEACRRVEELDETYWNGFALGFSAALLLVLSVIGLAFLLKAYL